QELVYKHAISTIVPARPVSDFGGEGSPEEA
ncbi:MAG: RNA chaperone Hfq, partial [Firmicutes bacterium]|nr:RNA chaperone Hfq [Bacillota bacterium]